MKVYDFTVPELNPMLPVHTAISQTMSGSYLNYVHRICHWNNVQNKMNVSVSTAKEIVEPKASPTIK